jgi:ketosteroid isomerase-like protein
MIIAGNVDAIMNQYTPDAVVRSNHAQPLRGQAAIRPFVQNMLAAVAFQSLTYETEDLAVHGDSAWHVVNYGLRGTMGNQPMADSGGAYILWTRDSAGSWRIKHDILNSRLPLLPAPAPPSR